MIESFNARLLGIVAGYLGWGFIAVLSLLPAASMPRTGVGGIYEHSIAYAAVGFSFGMGFTSLRLQFISGFMLALGALVFELIQKFIPGRDADIIDFFYSSLGAWLGLAVAMLATSIFKAVKG